jgi:hypothetical protein
MIDLESDGSMAGYTETPDSHYAGKRSRSMDMQAEQKTVDEY